jgi:hypothetical protein
LLHVVFVGGLPKTAASDELAHEDLSDFGFCR